MTKQDVWNVFQYFYQAWDEDECERVLLETTGNKELDEVRKKDMWSRYTKDADRNYFRFWCLMDEEKKQQLTDAINQYAEGRG